MNTINKPAHKAANTNKTATETYNLAVPRNRFVENYILNFTADDMPDHLIHQGKRCLLDLIGVLAAGSTTPLGMIISNHAHRHFNTSTGQKLRLLGDGRGSSALGVALAGGMMIDSIDAHDGMRLTKGHAGCGLLPALIALLEYQAKLDQHYHDHDLLTNLILGYEISIRAGIALHQSAADYHTSGAWVAIGVAALASRILGGDHNELSHAMGIAEYHGPRSQMMRTIDYPTMVKDGSGWGAMAGLSAGFLAQGGFTGAPAVTVTAETEHEIWADLGTVWHMVDQYIKPWPVCRWAQPAVTAAMDVMASHGLSPQDIAHIEVVSFHEAVRLATRIPENTETAQYSLPWPVAAAVCRGQVNTSEVTEPFDDPQMIALSTGMTLTEDDRYNDAFPSQRFAHVILTAHDGKTFTSETTQANWDPNAPPTDQEMIDKFHLLADAVMGRKKAEALVDLVFGLDVKNPNANNAKVIVDLISTRF